jgi:hypothetical protein
MEVLRDAAIRVLTGLRDETIKAIRDEAQTGAVAKMNPATFHFWLLKQEERVAVLEALIEQTKRMSGSAVVASSYWEGR